MRKGDRDHIDDILDDFLDQERIDDSQAEDMDESGSKEVVADIKSSDEIIKELNDKLKDAENKLLRTVADSENYRKRLIRETDDKIKYANQSLIKQFLPVLDNFDITLQHTEAENAQAIIDGVILVQKSMLDTLMKVGLTRIDVNVGDPFDPEIHEAISLCQNPELGNNTVSTVVQNGYKLGDRVIRPTKLLVNKI